MGAHGVAFLSLVTLRGTPVTSLISQPTLLLSERTEVQRAKPDRNTCALSFVPILGPPFLLLNMYLGGSKCGERPGSWKRTLEREVGGGGFKGSGGNDSLGGQREGGRWS